MKKQLSKSDIEQLNSEIQLSFGIADFFGKKDRIVLAENGEMRFVLKDDVPQFFYRDGKLVPTLKSLLQRLFLKKVVVDMGAVKFVSSGADVMRPGVVSADSSIQKDELVVVVDQQYSKPLCVALALFSGADLIALKQGRVLKALHHVGDVYWNYAA